MQFTPTIGDAVRAFAREDGRAAHFRADEPNFLRDLVASPRRLLGYLWASVEEQAQAARVTHKQFLEHIDANPAEIGRLFDQFIAAMASAFPNSKLAAAHRHFEQQELNALG